ncbi:MAG: hypothetical protein HY422_02480 [Candidatus Komeilibacteria bacterium]|nr:hypothetical protein [Candidatus Komeilibacteria bacterium]
MAWKPSDAVRTWDDIPSSTNPAKRYTVCMYPDGSFSCNCPRWANALRCRTCGGTGNIFKSYTACSDCNGTGRAARNCTHIVGIKAVFRLDAIDSQIDTGRTLPIVKRRITKADD